MTTSIQEIAAVWKIQIQNLVQCQWTYILRTCEIDPKWFESIVASLLDKFLPEILGKLDINSDLKNVFRLLSRLGGLGILNTTIDPSFEYKGSLEISTPLINHTNITEIASKHTDIASNIRQERHTRNSAKWEIPKSINDPLMKSGWATYKKGVNVLHG
ncbi:hypothetical protein GJ496_005504 [Pomphorhynchus laevis]|nr:hypothetical protein GJ496_005504 [Pomphorhynchus laevis]